MEKEVQSESPRRSRRRARLSLLITEVGGQARLARESGTPRSHVSAMLSGARGLGDELAKKLEEAFAKPPGWFDEPIDERDEPQPVDLEANPELVSVRTVKMRLQAGVTGFSIDGDQSDGPPIFFRGDWLKDRGYKPYNLVAIKIHGASMEPTLHQGDMVVINTADTDPRDGKAFAVNYEGEALVKRMHRDGGTWWLSSDNTDQRRFPRKECAEGSCIIIGRVIHRQSEEI